MSKRRPGMPRWCPTIGKQRHFNEAWAEIAAAEQAEALGSTFKTYRCPCGWWHTYDRRKARAKDEAHESRAERRRRSKRGDPPPPTPAALFREQKKTTLRRRSRVRKSLPFRVWQDDGGAFYPPRYEGDA